MEDLSATAYKRDEPNGARSAHAIGRNNQSVSRRKYVALGTRVLIMTLYEFPELCREARNVGALGFVGKADTGRCLIPAVRCLAEHKAYFPNAN